MEIIVQLYPLMDSSSVGEEDSAAALMFMPLRACLHLYLSEKLL
jgi:hypothetical protein